MRLRPPRPGVMAVALSVALSTALVGLGLSHHLPGSRPTLAPPATTTTTVGHVPGVAPTTTQGVLRVELAPVPPPSAPPIRGASPVPPTAPAPTTAPVPSPTTTRPAPAPTTCVSVVVSVCLP